jgi:DNA modification methylase
MVYSDEFKKSDEYKRLLQSNKKWYEKNKEKRKQQMKEYRIKKTNIINTPTPNAKRKKIRPTDINPSYSYISGDPTKNERINFKHWNDLLFGKDDDNDTTYSNLWLYRNPQKVEPFRDDIGSPSQTQAQKLGKKYFSEFNPLVAENILNFWSDENDTILDPFAGRIRGIVTGLKHRYYIGFEISPEVHKSVVKIIHEGKDKFDKGFLPIIHLDDAMNIPKYNLPKVDCIFSCPPYHNLEEYESVPGQLSDIKDYSKFLIQMKEIMRLSLDKLKDNGFCCLVVGDYRVKDKLINFDYDTVKMMEELGVQLWDKVILQNINFGWAGIKFGHVKHKRMTSKVTEYLLVFKKVSK